MLSLRVFLEEKGFKRVRLQKINSNHYQLEAKINGVPGKFILDTGASNSCIAMESIDYFKLHTAESAVKAAGAGAVNMETQLSENNKMHIAQWKKQRVDFVIFDMSHVNEALQIAEAESVHGIIGADILKPARAIIDYGRNCMYLK